MMKGGKNIQIFAEDTNTGQTLHMVENRGTSQNDLNALEKEAGKSRMKFSIYEYYPLKKQKYGKCRG